MANSALLQLLKQSVAEKNGCAAWNRRRSEQPSEPIDLFGASLSGADLSQANLSSVRLAMADLSLSNLTGANLALADLSYANLSGVNFTAASLLRTTLVGVQVGSLPVIDESTIRASQGQIPEDFLRNCRVSADLIALAQTLQTGGQLSSIQAAIATKTVFISYAREDAEFVDRLERSLNERGIRTWVDRRRLEGGQLWSHEIEAAIGACVAFIAVLSPDSEKSRWVVAEYHRAIEVGKPVIPVLVRPTSIPLILNVLQVISFENAASETRYQAALEELMRSLAHL